MSEKGLEKTKNEFIHIDCPVLFNIAELLRQLNEFLEAAYKNADT